MSGDFAVCTPKFYRARAIRSHVDPENDRVAFRIAAANGARSNRQQSGRRAEFRSAGDFRAGIYGSERPVWPSVFAGSGQSSYADATAESPATQNQSG